MSLSRLLQLAFCFGGALLLAGLGVWQLQRLNWKQGLIDQAEARMYAEPADAAGLRGISLEDVNFVRAIVEGEPIDKPVRVLHATKTQGVGFRFLYPYAQADGHVIFVDLGYAPDPSQGNVSDAPEVIPPEPAPIEGVLRVFTDRGWLTPENNRAENYWFAQDLDEMADYVGAPLALPAILVATDPSPGRYPIRTPVTADLPNNHLNYAITWFGLAIAWAGLSLVWLRRRRDADS